ncbi:MAG: hypothetical protein LC775_20480, partial [Acidobacteria bacterium]|nr:hypothetical protein [Acidobacteriota bacterium]
AASSVSLFPMIFGAQGTVFRLAGADGWRVGLGEVVSRLLHHQKPPAPSSAIKITPRIAILMAQRIASFTTRKKITSKTTPAMMEMVVPLIRQLGGSAQSAVSRKEDFSFLIFHLSFSIENRRQRLAIA